MHIQGMDICSCLFCFYMMIQDVELRRQYNKKELANLNLGITLTISLHAPNDEM